MRALAQLWCLISAPLVGGGASGDERSQRAVAAGAPSELLAGRRLETLIGGHPNELCGRCSCAAAARVAAALCVKLGRIYFFAHYEHGNAASAACSNVQEEDAHTRKKNSYNYPKTWSRLCVTTAKRNNQALFYTLMYLLNNSTLFCA